MHRKKQRKRRVGSWWPVRHVSSISNHATMLPVEKVSGNVHRLAFRGPILKGVETTPTEGSRRVPEGFPKPAQSPIWAVLGSFA